MVLHQAAFMTIKPNPHIIHSQVQSPLMRVNITDKHNVTLYFGYEVWYMKATLCYGSHLVQLSLLSFIVDDKSFSYLHKFLLHNMTGTPGSLQGDARPANYQTFRVRVKQLPHF